MAKTLLVCAALSCALAVLLGAFGAHGLKARLTPDMMAVYQTAVQYHMWHGLGLGLVSIASTQWPGLVRLRVAGWLMVVGMILFCGSLYLLAVTEIKMLGAITPIGGVLLIASWWVFAWTIMRGEA